MGRKKYEEAEARAELAKKLSHDKFPVRRGWSGGIKFCVPTGLMSVDITGPRDPAGIYGIPSGCVTTVYGKYKVGKTSLVLTAMANAQKPDPLNRRPPMQVYYCGMEDANMSGAWMEVQGVDLDDLWSVNVRDKEYTYVDTDGKEKTKINEIKTLQDVYESIRVKLMLLDKMKADDPLRRPLFAVIDSTSATPTDSEDELAPGEESTGGADHARTHSKKLRQIGGLLARTDSILIIIAQAKENISFHGKQSQETIIASRPIFFHANLVLYVYRRETLWEGEKKGGDPIGMIVGTKVDYSKVCIPYGKADPLEFYYETGFDWRLSLHDAAVKKGFVTHGAGKNANLWTFGLKSKEPISYREATGIRELPDWAIREIYRSFYLSDEAIAKRKAE